MRKMLTMALALTMITGLLLAVPTSAQDEEETPMNDGVAVTAYNEGSALVRDRRTFDFESGVNILDFTDVAAQIDATSVIFSSLTDPDGTIVLEQNYVYDLVNSSALLQRYLDETISVTTEDGTAYTGQLLSGRSGEIILRTDAGGVVVLNMNSVRDVQFPELPDGLITRPTLRWLVSSQQSGPQQVELTYLTNGISWTADYNLLLARDNRSLDLNGWVTLNNTSGTGYHDAQLKLVAGDVNRISPQPTPPPMERAVMMAMDMAESSVEQREFFEYQLYEIGRLVTIGNNETKQVEFVTGSDVTANTFYVYDASPVFYGYYDFVRDRSYGATGITTVQNYLEFSTDEEGGLGADLPAGRVRVYQEDVDGAALLIGENRISHTPKGEDIQLYLGNAFDLVGERIQTNFELISDTVIRETYEIRLRNRKDDQTVEIRVPERLTRWSNWEIQNSSHPYEQRSSNNIEFRVEVAPGEEVVLTYTVQYSWRR